MKGIKKYLFMLMALAAVFSFVACSDDDDDDDDELGTVIFSTTPGADSGGEVGVMILTFNSNKTFLMEFVGTYEGEEVEHWTAFQGRYEGNPSKDGEIILIIEKMRADDNEDFFSKELVDVTPPESVVCQIVNGEFIFGDDDEDVDDEDVDEFKFIRR